MKLPKRDTQLFLVDANVFIAAIKMSRKFIPKAETVDIIHAATCIQERSILITNDKHFNKISENSIIEVWNISKAIENLLGKQ